jgi:hypothetical protein
MRVRSHRFDAVLDRLLDSPERLLISAVKSKRRAQALASRGGRWLQRCWLFQSTAVPRQMSTAVVGSVITEHRAAVDGARGERFLLYRIVGNDLYPRHDAGQSLANLRFTLDHEPPLPGCEKRWLLNRIRQPHKLEELIDLLERHGCGYDVIPFEPEVFAAVPWDWDVLPRPDFLGSRAYRQLLSHQRQSWEIALYRHKNNYLMHNNGARNLALELGCTRADWVLPWDGNCFLTAAGWKELREAVLRQSGADYFYVPMQRIADNAHLLDPAFQADPRDEPQLVFAATAPERFNPAFPYGRRPKVELFWRLGLPGVWDAWLDEPWDQPRRPRLEPVPPCPQAGWVARLHSGVRDAGGGAAAAVLSQKSRYGARNLAIKASVNQALLAQNPLAQAAFAAHWEAPLQQAALRCDLQQQAGVALELLQAWQHWWQQRGPAPAGRQESLVSALLHVCWLALLDPEQSPDPALLESVGSQWFAPGDRGLQPRLRLLQRPLASGRLPGTEPSLAAVEQLALLSDLMAWRPGSWSWQVRFLAWRDAIAEQLHTLIHPAWLGQREQDLQRLQLVLALMQRHRGLPVEPVDALLRLLSQLQLPNRTLDPQRALVLALAQQHGLLTPEQAAGVVHPPMPPLLPLSAADQR